MELHTLRRSVLSIARRQWKDRYSVGVTWSLLQSGGKHWPSRCYRKDTPAECGTPPLEHDSGRKLPVGVIRGVFTQPLTKWVCAIILLAPGKYPELERDFLPCYIHRDSQTDETANGLQT